MLRFKNSDIHTAINKMGNREQHFTVSIGKNKKVQRRGDWVTNSHISKKTGMTYNYFKFY